MQDFAKSNLSTYNNFLDSHMSVHFGRKTPKVIDLPEATLPFGIMESGFSCGLKMGLGRRSSFTSSLLRSLSL